MLKTIFLDEISTNNKYLRLGNDVEDLIKSIERIGLIHPLTVNENYELLAGGRRYTASKMLGKTKIEVKVVKNNELLEELISIDENLIRKPLNDIEFDSSLKRGKDLYNKLNPDAPKTEEESLLFEDGGLKSYPDITAQKLGISPKKIWNAIERDESSSSQIKQARATGEISTSDTNKIIKLEKSEQNDLLPYIVEAPKKKIKDIIDTAKEKGIDKAINQAKKIKPIQKEFEALKGSSQKMEKSLKKILAEQIEYKGDDLFEILESVKNTKNKLNEFLRLYSE